MRDTAVEMLKALAHPLRFRILETLRSGEHNVGEIEAMAGIGQPALSQQLGILRKAGLVATRKEAKLVYYRLREDRMRELAELIGTLAPAAPLPAAASRSPSPGVANFARIG